MTKQTDFINKIYKYSAKSGQQSLKHILNIWRFFINRREKYEIQEPHFWRIWKSNRAAIYNDIDSNLIIKVYNEISYPSFLIFCSWLSESIFPEQLKVTKVFPILKVGDTEEVRNYWPILVLPIFSKLLERLMYNRTYLTFKENDILIPKQFGF